MDICGKRIELQVRRSNRVRGHRMVVRYGLPPELVVRPRATQAQIDEAIDFHRSWLELQLAKTIEPRLGLDRLTLTEEQGRVEARARILDDEDARHAHKLLDRKYGLVKRIGHLFGKLMKRQHAAIGIELA